MTSFNAIPTTDTEKVLLHLKLADSWYRGGAGWSYHMGCVWYFLLKEITS